MGASVMVALLVGCSGEGDATENGDTQTQTESEPQVQSRDVEPDFADEPGTAFDPSRIDLNSDASGTNEATGALGDRLVTGVDEDGGGADPDPVITFTPEVVVAPETEAPAGLSSQTQVVPAESEGLFTGPDGPVDLAESIELVHTDAATDALLNLIEAAAAEVRGVRTRVSFESADALTGDVQLRRGFLTYRAPADGVGTMFRVHFVVFSAGGGQPRDTNLTFVSDGNYLAEIDGETQAYTRYTLRQDPEAPDPFAIGSGPLPLPLGLRKNDVLARFAVTRLPGEARDPESSVQLRLVPLPGAAVDSGEVRLWFHEATGIPMQAASIGADGVSRKTFTLEDPDWTEVAEASVFSTAPPAEATVENGWHLEIQP